MSLNNSSTAVTNDDSLEQGFPYYWDVRYLVSSGEHTIHSELKSAVTDIALQRRLEKIKEYEEQFGMTSAEFLRKWEEGTVDDTYETNHWANLLRRK